MFPVAVLALVFSIPAANFMLIGTTVTLHAIAEIADTFLYVFATNVFWNVLVTTIRIICLAPLLVEE